jgi:hypothetical protein
MSRRRAPARGSSLITVAKFAFALLLLFCFKQRDTLAESHGPLTLVAAGALAIVALSGFTVWLAGFLRGSPPPDEITTPLPPARPLRKLPRSIGGMSLRAEAIFTRELLEELAWQRFEKLVAATREPLPASLARQDTDLDALLVSVNSLEESVREALYREITTGDYTTPACPVCRVRMRPGKDPQDSLWICRNAPACVRTFPRT